MKTKQMYWRLIGSILALLSLAGCGSLKGLGEGLQNVFKGFHMP